MCSPPVDSLGYILITDSMDLASVNYYIVGVVNYQIVWKMCDDGHWSCKGHWFWILVVTSLQFDLVYMTGCCCCISQMICRTVVSEMTNNLGAGYKALLQILANCSRTGRCYVCLVGLHHRRHAAWVVQWRHWHAARCYTEVPQTTVQRFACLLQSPSISVTGASKKLSDWVSDWLNTQFFFVG